MRNLFADPYSTRKIVSEIQILRTLSQVKDNKHTSLLHDVIADFDQDYIFLVMEYIDSDLKKVFNSTRKIDFNDDHVLIIIYNLLCSLNFLHSANIMHRDIKPANILIDGECQVKLCDFGFSRSIPTNLILPKPLDNTNARTGIISPKHVKKLPSLGLGQSSPLVSENLRE